MHWGIIKGRVILRFIEPWATFLAWDKETRKIIGENAQIRKR